MITPPLPSTCLECPFARHLDRNRFSCGNSLTKVVKSHFAATDECRDAIIARPDKFVQPSLLPDFKGLDLEWIVNDIKLTMHWLDVYPECVILDGDNLIEVGLDNLRIGYIKKRNHLYYSDRLFGIESLDPNWIALNMVHPDYLDGVVDNLIATRELMPEYI